MFLLYLLNSHKCINKFVLIGTIRYCMFDSKSGHNVSNFDRYHCDAICHFDTICCQVQYTSLTLHTNTKYMLKSNTRPLTDNVLNHITGEFCGLVKGSIKRNATILKSYIFLDSNGIVTLNV